MSQKKGYKHTEETKKKISFKKRGCLAWNKGRVGVQIVSDETRLKLSLARKGKPSGMLGKKLSDETKKKLSDIRRGRKCSTETRIKMSLLNRGSKSHFWRGGITSVNKAIRNGIEFRLWRTAVFERDNYTCQECGIKGYKGLGHRVILHPHHIKPFSLFPELRFAIDNGVTLCADCHHKTDSWGLNINKKSTLTATLSVPPQFSIWGEK